MKKICLILALLFCTTFSLSAAISWEFEIKGNAGFNFVNEQYLFSNNDYKDFCFTPEIDVTLCFGRYFGIDLLFGVPILTYPTPKIADDNWCNHPGIFGGLGLAFMFPITDSFKVKLVAGYSILDYERHSYGWRKTKYGYNDYVADSFSTSCFFGSIGSVWMPLKHFGFTFGSTFLGGVDSNTDKTFSQSGYKITTKYKYFYVSPYIGAVVRLGRKL